MTVRKLEKSEWSAFFNGVSKSLKDAHAEIEIASLKLGDQIQSTWLPLYGVAYDPKDDIFEIALKGLDHLVQKPREVYLDEEGGKLVNVEIVDAANNHQIVRFREPFGARNS
jgi:outer membrane lipoprotein-sorting protein